MKNISLEIIFRCCAMLAGLGGISVVAPAPASFTEEIIIFCNVSQSVSQFSSVVDLAVSVFAW